MTDEGAAHYLLGHEEMELRRLDLQGTLYRDITLRSLVEAGIGPGMRVLDVGCGTGEVSMLAAGLVGEQGEVVGVDRSEAAVATARRKAQARGVSNAAFERRGLSDALAFGVFDAVVGRFVLMHQADPAKALGAVARAARSGGAVVMMESWMDLIRERHSEPYSPLYDAIVRFKCEVVRRAGADTAAGGRLRTLFRDAGLPEPVCRLDARLEGGPDSPYYEYVAESVRSMLPEAARTGVEGFETRDIDGLAERLRHEVVASNGTLVVWPLVRAIARMP